VIVHPNDTSIPKIIDEDVRFHYFRVRGADLILQGRIAC